MATGDRGLKSTAKVRFSVCACPGDAQIGKNPPQTRAFLRRPVVGQNDENAWLTRQSRQTGLRDARAFTGKIQGNLPKTGAGHGSKRSIRALKGPEIREVRDTFPIGTNREPAAGYQGIRQTSTGHSKHYIESRINIGLRGQAGMEPHHLDPTSLPQAWLDSIRYRGDL